MLHHYAAGFFPAIIFGDLALSHSRLERYVYGTPLDLAVAGNFSVCIFFVLSGYVLSFKFFHGKGYGVLVSSAARRYLRLMPAVLGTVMIAYILMRLGLFFNLSLAPATHSQAWLGTFWRFPPSLTKAVHEGVIGSFMDGTSAYDSSLWTMHYEFFGSFIVFGFLALFGQLRNRSLLYLGAALAFYNSYFLAFIAGIWLCDNTDNLRQFIARLRSRYLPALMISAGLVFGTVPIASTRYQFNLPLFSADSAFAFVHIVGAVLLLTGIVLAPSVQRFLVRRPFQFLGRISFSLYLLHVLVLGSLSSYLFSNLILHHSYKVSFVVMFVPSLVLIILISHFYTNWIDDAAVRYSGVWYRRFIGRAHTREQAAPPESLSEPLSGTITV